MSEDDLRLSLESVRGEVRRLDTILKMSMAEQRRINQEFTGALRRQAIQGESALSRLDRLNTKLATYTGGVVALWLIFQVLARTILK